MLSAMVPMSPLPAPQIRIQGSQTAADIGSLNAEPFAATAMDQQAMPTSSITPYWTDFINTENVDNTGENVYVAVLDTGLLPNYESLFPHAKIATDLGIGFTHDWYYDPSDNYIKSGPLRSDRGFITDMASGHGTHVTSTIVGFDMYGDHVQGVAPDVTIIPVLVLDAWTVDTPYGPYQFNFGTWEMISAGIYYIANLADQLDGPVIINMSLGGGYSAMVEDAIDYAISKGVKIVVSAGNEDEAGMGYPGALPQSISTAAVGWTDMFSTGLSGWLADVPEDLNTPDSFGNNFQVYLTNFSSRPNKDLGQKHQDLDVAAPGDFIVGPYKPVFSNAFAFYFLSGTSMAAPHVTGMVAMILQDYPDLTQSQVEFILKRAAHGMPLPADGAFGAYPIPPFQFWYDWDGGDYGAGFLQADTAMNSAMLYNH